MAEYKASSSKEKEEVLSKLKEIDKKYSLEEFTPNEITSLGLEKQEFTSPTEDEILNQAKEELSTERQNDLNKIETNYNKKFSSLSSKIENLETEKDDDLENILQSYKNSAKKTTNNSIKQGISRSSILSEALKELENTKETETNETLLQFNKNLERLNGEKEILEMQKQSALDSFDISYAVKLENKIEKINSEISKKQKEVDAYNENVEKLEAENVAKQEKENATKQAEVEKRNKKLLEEQEKLGTQFYVNKYKEKYDVVLEYLMSLPKEEALNELTKDNTYEMLLSMYYPAVYAQISNRKE